MNWFKENKFLGGLLVLTVILAALLILLGLNTATKRDEAASRRAEQKSEIAGNKKLNPFPTPENVDAKKKNLKDVISRAEKARAMLLSFRPESLDNITVSSFAERLKAADSKVKQVCAENSVKLSDDSYLGFESYKGAAPKETATGILAYQIDAISWMLHEIATSGVTAITNLDRPEVSEETAVAPSNNRRASRRGSSSRARGSSRRTRANSGPSLVEVSRKLPVSVTFKGPEASVRKAIQKIANSDQYFFEARAFRVKNPSPVPTSKGAAIKKLAVEEEEIPADDFGFVEEEVAAEDVPASASQILYRVAGGDDVSAFVQFDLVLFDESKSFPETK